MKKELVYKPSEYQRHLWDYHKLCDEPAKRSEDDGTKRYEAFPDFAAEVYHRLYADKPEPLKEPAEGSEVFQKFHDKIGEVPEFKDLQQRCQGDERWSGIGTASMLDDLLTKVEPPEQKVEDIRDDEEVQKYLQQLIGNEKDEENKEQLQEMLDGMQDPNNPNSTAAKKERTKQTADMMDDTQIREAIRGAAKAANADIDAEEAMIDSFSFGMDPHSGNKARRAAHKQLSEIISQNKRLQEIAKLAGRLRRIATEQQRQKPKKGTDEMTGIEMGGDLSKMVPAEALLASDEFEGIFAKKLHEKSLLQFETSKIPKKEQGPIVVVLDSSGSMSWNGADTWAAAVTLAFLEIAFEQKRAFAIIHFGSTVLRTDIFDDWKDIDRKAILDSVSYFASDGGTCFEEPMSKAVEIIDQTGSYSEADVVMITDGQAWVDDDWLKSHKERKEELDFKTYSILIGHSCSADVNEKFSDDVTNLFDVLGNDESMHKFFKAV